jgi:hypothetical protein
MDNPFKNMEQSPKEVPEELKKKVMDDVSSYLLFMEVSTLFTSNFTEAVESFLKKRDENKNDFK